jgi:hypothetical protein
MLLSGMRLIGSQMWEYLIFSVLFIVVGLALVLFRKLGRPITVSVCSVIVSIILGENLMLIAQGQSLTGIHLWQLIAGAGYGLFAFLVFHEVLFISDFIRSVLNHYRDR